MNEKKFNKIYWLKNFETNKNMTFSETNISFDTLKSYNENWYNIYETVNTFIWNKRQIKDLAEIKSCFIDIDYPEIITNNLSNADRASFMKDKYILLCEKLGSLKKKYWITPSIFNATYKGFHILFHYSKDCYFINEELHLKINDILNEYLWWDPNARDIARVYKTVWFIDWKEGRKRKIKSFAGESSGFLNITKTIIKERFWFEFKEREIDNVKKKQRSQEKKEIVKNSNIEKINNLDSWYFIWKIISYLNYNEDIFCPFDLLWKDKNIEKNFYLLKIKNKLKYKEINENLYKFYEEDGETLTAGLTLEKDENWIWKINDYSKKTRRWNYNFLKNWILKDKEFDYSEFSKILFNTTSLVLNSNLDKKTEINSQATWNYLNNELSSKEKEILREHNDLIESNFKEIEDIKEQHPWLTKVFYAFLTFLKEEITSNKRKCSSSWHYEITLNEFAEKYLKMEKKYVKNHKTYLKFLIKKIWEFWFPYLNEIMEKTKSWWEKKIETLSFKKLFDFDFSISKWWNNCEQKLFFKFAVAKSENFLYINKSPFYYNKNILSYQPWLKNTKISDFFINVDSIINNKNFNYKNKLKNIYEFLNFTSTDKINKKTLTKHLKEGIKLWFFKSYKFEDDNLIISKFQYIS